MTESNAGYRNYDSNPSRLATTSERTALFNAINYFSRRSWTFPDSIRDHHRGLSVSDGSEYAYAYRIHVEDAEHIVDAPGGHCRWSHFGHAPPFCDGCAITLYSIPLKFLTLTS